MPGCRPHRNSYDNYTLLFPLKAYWDTSPTVIDAGTYNLPVGSGSAELMAVKYPAEGGGYTPGETWELYVAKDGRVEYFVYHRGGAKKPALLLATWGGQKKQVRCSSQPIAAAMPMASRYVFGIRMWQSR